MRSVRLGHVNPGADVHSEEIRNFAEKRARMIGMSLEGHELEITGLGELMLAERSVDDVEVSDDRL